MAHQQRGNRRCPTCHTFPDIDPRHWKACVPKRHWPDWMRQPALVGPTVAVSEYETDEGLIVLGGDNRIRSITATDDFNQSMGYSVYGGVAKLDPLLCECGYEAGSAAAMRMHRSRAKQHRQAMPSA